MAKYYDAKCRLCRREGTKLLLKGDRCFTDKCAFDRRPYAPGQHGRARKKLSDYAVQLREKQKCRRAYGLLETQFYKTYERATNMKGITGDNLLSLLERRLDNVVYRSGLGASRPQARQLVLHGHILVNGKKVDVPSYTVEENDVITVRAKSKEMLHFKAVREGNASRILPKWLTFNADELTATVVALPVREDIDFALQENMIVEFYSR